MEMQTKPRMYKVVTPVERNGKTFWMRIGSAFPAKNDASAMNVYLDALPRDPKQVLHVRELDEEDLQRRRAPRGADAEGPAMASTEDLPF